MNVAGIHHLTLRSRDPEVARRFYQEVVGLEFMEIPVSGEVTSIWRGAPAEGVLLAAQAGETFLVIAPPLEGRHPDHWVSAQLIRDACFLAGLTKLAPEIPKHRPHKILHALAYRQDFVRPTFVVDISDEFEQKMAAVRCYSSQFDGEIQAGEVYPNGEPLYDIVTHHAATYGSLIRTRYGEPYFTTEMMRVDDVVSLEVATF